MALSKITPQSRRESVSLDQYHAVPKGWLADEIVALHRQLAGTYPIGAFEIGQWHAPAWMTQRYEWLRYRAVLQNVANGVRAGDGACTEIAVRYILLAYFGSYSGYLRDRLARALRHSAMTERQKSDLRQHSDRLKADQTYYCEFRSSRKLLSTLSD